MQKERSRHLRVGCAGSAAGRDAPRPAAGPGSPCQRHVVVAAPVGHAARRGEQDDHSAEARAEGDGTPVDSGVDLLDDGGLGHGAVRLDGDGLVDGRSVVPAEAALIERGAGDGRGGGERGDGEDQGPRGG